MGIKFLETPRRRRQARFKAEGRSRKSRRGRVMTPRARGYCTAVAVGRLILPRGRGWDFLKAVVKVVEVRISVSPVAVAGSSSREPVPAFGRHAGLSPTAACASRCPPLAGSMAASGGRPDAGTRGRLSEIAVAKYPRRTLETGASALPRRGAQSGTWRRAQDHIKFV